MADAKTPSTSAPKGVFVSPLAGRWYDADKTALESEIDAYLAKTDAPPLENVHALIVPHAGYRYSGQVACFAAKQIAGKSFQRVVIMGPSHRVPMQNVASVPDYSAYATPLGEIPLDVDFILALKRHPQFRTMPGADEGEHSVQIQLPILQRAIGSFKLVPIVVGQIDSETAREMAKILAGLVDADTLVVASSDFTHYGQSYGYVPFTKDIEANLKKLDMGAWDWIAKKDADGFANYVDETGATICGQCPIGVLLALLPQDAEAHLLKYDTSGRMTNDTTTSVSYLAVAFTCAWKKGEVVPPEPAPSAALSDEDKAALLKLARATLTAALENRKVSAPEDLGIATTPGMKQVMGAFVTLKKHGDLRGCIGEIVPRRALYKAVMEQAVNAGLNDYRFSPVQPSELADIEFEISALTPSRPVDSYNDIVLGKHGMVLQKNGHSAVFLPQVAPEQGWDIAETLTHLSMKAGLPPDAWKEGASYTVFEAIVFHETPEK